MSKPSNGYDAEKLNGYLAEIALVDDELLTLKGEYMQACKGPRSKIKDILAAAKEDGELNMVAFREILTQAPRRSPGRAPDCRSRK